MIYVIKLVLLLIGFSFALPLGEFLTEPEKKRTQIIVALFLSMLCLMLGGFLHA